MGWKSTLRSLESASRRAAQARERNARQLQRELQRLEKESAKAADQERAMLEVRRYENTIELLSSIHRDCGDPVDWKAVATSPQPQPPQQPDAHERSAAEALAAYSPGIFARLFGTDKKRRQELEADVEHGRQMDADIHRRALKDHHSAVEEWQAEVSLATRVIAGDVEAWGEAAQELGRYQELGEWGVGVSVTLGRSDRIGVTLSVPDDAFVPEKKKTLTSTGKLSEKALPKGTRGEIYQDFVCGALLRAVRESLALFPVEYVVATARTKLLNSTTGHLEFSPIASVICPRTTVEQINMSAADASNALANFKCRMNFRKTVGFVPIEAFTLEDIPQ